MKNNIVSILIPSYNHEKFVIQTLDSILQDSYSEKEIVIIDDGSTDSSVKLIKKWKTENESKIRVVFIARENKGLTFTLNELRRIAIGQYFVIIASDDFLLPDSIEKRIRVLKSNPQKMVVFGDAHVVDENSEIIQNSSIEDYSCGNKRKLYDDDGILDAALFAPAFSGPLELVDRDVYKIIGDYPEYLTVEDWFFWQRVAIKKLAVFLDDYVCCYRRHDSNITNGKNDEKLHRDVIRTCLMNLRLLRISKLKIRFFIFIIKKVKSYIKLCIKNKLLNCRKTDD